MRCLLFGLTLLPAASVIWVFLAVFLGALRGVTLAIVLLVVIIVITIVVVIVIAASGVVLIVVLLARVRRELSSCIVFLVFRLIIVLIVSYDSDVTKDSGEAGMIAATVALALAMVA